jgi:hypothetical protein
VTALIVSFQIFLGTFFLSILGIRHTRHPAIGALETAEDEREAAPGKLARTRPDATGTVGVDAGAPSAATGIAAQPEVPGTSDKAAVPATAGTDAHAGRTDQA